MISPDSLHQEILSKIGKAAAKNDVAEVVRLAELAKKANAVVQDAAASLGQIKAQIESSAGDKAVNHSSPNPLAGKQLSPKASGKDARKQWCNELAKSGFPLTYSGGPYFSTNSGKTIAIAYAAEKPERPGKFFLGLPDKLASAFVLLCKSANGKVADPVLPDHLLKKYWGSLSRSEGQLKFNLRVSNQNVQLHIPGQGWIGISEFVSNYAPLQ